MSQPLLTEWPLAGAAVVAGRPSSETARLADGERIDQALAEAAAKPEQAAVVAKQAYAELVAGGMAEALAGVRQLYRSAGERRWQAAPMTRRFRDSYAGVIPGTAPGLPWSATVAPPR
jgi:hypothetical protein